MLKKRNRKVDFEYCETEHFNFLKIFFKIKVVAKSRDSQIVGNS